MVRNLTLHGMLEQFTTEAGVRLELAASAEEIPFEVVESGGRVPLYCYRPLTAGFIRSRLGMLLALPSYAPAVRALEGVGGTDSYLRARGELLPAETPRAQADLALRCFIARVFEERSEFGFDPDRFEVIYDELERAIYQGRCVTEVIAPLLGLDLDASSAELPLGDGLSIVRPAALPNPPAEVSGPGGPALVLVLRVAHDRVEQPSVSFARTRFRRILTALRLYERGGYAIGPLGYSRIDDGAWAAVPLGTSGRPRLLTLVPAGGEDELRAFCSLIGRRLPGPAADSSGAGEIAWALARFEMGCERIVPFEALSDYLLALRSLLEPEGPASGRLAQRLAVICAAAEDRARLAERTAQAISLERAVITGLAPASNEADLLVDELAENLRAILRDVLCGHLNADVRGLADELLALATDEVAV
jgi:hypothetical protein